MGQAREKHNKEPASHAAVNEYKVWEERWIRCCKELNQVLCINESASYDIASKTVASGAGTSQLTASWWWFPTLPMCLHDVIGS